jgi:chitinase
MESKSVTLRNAAFIAVGLFLLALSPSLLMAAQVTLRWDANQTAPDGYRLYQSNAAQGFDYSSPVWSGQAIEHTVAGLDSNKTYYFVVRAFKGNSESGDSNMVQFPEPGSVPPPVSDPPDQIPPPADDPPPASGGDGSNQDPPVSGTPDETPPPADNSPPTSGGDNPPPNSGGEGSGQLPPGSGGHDSPVDNPKADNPKADDPKDDAAPPQTPDPGSDVSPDPGHTNPPGRPVLLPVTPHSGNRVSLTPMLEVEPYFQGASTTHRQTVFQISTSDDPSLDDFDSLLVFERAFTQHRTRFQVPALILDPDEDYYWRVRFIDSANGASQWSDWASFTTIDHDMADVVDGVPHEQWIDPFDPDQWIVLAGAELQAEIDAGLQGVNTADAFNPQLAVRQIDGKGSVVAVRALHGADLPDLNRPEHMTGVISFKLHLEQGESTALVRVYFSQPAPPNAKWYKYDPDHGWRVYPYATFSADLRSVILELEDGGTGDMDGVRNGVIVDPGGIGYTKQNSVAVDYTPPVAGGSGGGGCFMGISMQSLQADSTHAVNVAALLLITALTGLAIVARRFVPAAR